MDVNTLVTDFNNTLLGLALNIASVCPTSVIGTNITDIEKTFKNKSYFNKFIDLFCVKVLKYKTEIDNGEESFFMKKDYTSDVADLNGSGDLLSNIISLQSVWNQLTKENKDIVILNMQILCALAQEYFDISMK